MPHNQVILLLGSNIDPAINIRKALAILASRAIIIKQSNIWKTKAVGSNGPDFLNLAVEIKTDLSAEEIKSSIVTPVEKELKRIRVRDKYAPRTIDVDIIVFNDRVVDSNLWTRLFVALPVSELVPELINDLTNETLSCFVKKIKSPGDAELFKG